MTVGVSRWFDACAAPPQLTIRAIPTAAQQRRDKRFDPDITIPLPLVQHTEKEPEMLLHAVEFFSNQFDKSPRRIAKDFDRGSELDTFHTGSVRYGELGND